MNINATILIQIINFSLVYWLLRNLLFRPVVTVIDSELSEKVALVNLVDQQKKSIEIQEKERERHWYTCREYFRAHRPLSLRHTILINTNIVEDDKYMTDILYEDNLVADVYKALEEKIKNVH